MLWNREAEVQERARVLKINGDCVDVVPLDIEVCLGCSNSECRTHGSVFTARNRKKLNLSVGTHVRIGASPVTQALQAVLSIGAPIVIAVTVWWSITVCIPELADSWRVGFTLLGLVSGAVACLVITGKWKAELPEVLEIL